MRSIELGPENSNIQLISMDPSIVSRYTARIQALGEHGRLQVGEERLVKPDATVFSKARAMADSEKHILLGAVLAMPGEYRGSFDEPSTDPLGIGYMAGLLGVRVTGSQGDPAKRELFVISPYGPAHYSPDGPVVDREALALLPRAMMYEAIRLATSPERTEFPRVF